jgi:hypothetical protein
MCLAIKDVCQLRPSSSINDEPLSYANINVMHNKHKDVQFSIPFIMKYLFSDFLKIQK